MPAAQSLFNVRRGYTRRRIGRMREDIELGTGKVLDARRAAATSRGAIAKLDERSGGASEASTQDKVMYMTFLGLIAAVYIVDIVLLAAALNYAVRDSETGALAAYVPYLVPACIILIEMALGQARHQALLSELSGQGSRANVVGWTIACVICSCVVEATVLSWVVSRESDVYTPWVSIPLAVGIVGLPLVAHLFIALSGERSLESKAWVAYALQHRRLQAAAIRQETRATQAGRQVKLLFTRYSDGIAQYNAANVEDTADHLMPGPFHRETQAFLRELFDAEAPAAAGPTAAQAGGGPQATPQPPPRPQEPGPVGGTAPSSDPDPWAAFFARQVRDAESEVRV
ncbi:MAG: hypothetical protein U0Q55_04340 [Vicinamibacterales bacterium]